MRTDTDARRRDPRPFSDRPLFKPLALLLLVPVILITSGLVAIVLAPPFLGAAFGVKRVDAKLNALGADFTRIPKFPERSVIYANDGKTVLATVFLDNRELVHLKDVSKPARRAVLAIEDSGFYDHGALSWSSLVRALVENARAGAIVQGGSTITQQLVKNTLGLDPLDRSFERKFQELALALRVEEKYSKHEILELYLNQVYLANGVYGIGTASKFYFGKPASKLTLQEGATLAGMIRRPEYYDPLDRPVKMRVRRNDVLNRMMALGPDWLRRSRGERLKTKPLTLAKGAGKLELKQPPFFVTYVREQIIQNPSGVFDVLGRSVKARQRIVLEGGLRIVTTLDPEWQAYAHSAANQPYNITPAHPPNAPPPDTSIVSIETGTGAIRTMLSGRNFQRDELDLATEPHQPGSSFKPYILAAAFEKGIPPTQTYSSSSPITFPGYINPDGSPWVVYNAEGAGNGGFIDLYSATTNSVNVVFAQLILDVGAEYTADTAERMMGLQELSGRELLGVPSLATGSVGISPLEQASGYQTLANGGVHCTPFAVAQIVRDGKTLFEHVPDCERVLKSDIAHQITAMLETVPQFGTAATAFSGWSPWPVAGKTGTANENVAVWFGGYTRQVSTAVWVGPPGNQYSMGPSAFGGTIAAPIWRDYMSRVMQGMAAISFPLPPRPPEEQVPNVVGRRQQTATSILGAAGFRVDVERVDSSAEEGTVVAQSPGAGTLAVVGTAVRIQVSTGIAPINTVPRVVGMAVEEARRVLEEAGFVVAIVEKETGDPKKEGIVLFQQPGGGTKAKEGTTVTLNVGAKKAKR